MIDKKHIVLGVGEILRGSQCKNLTMVTRRYTEKALSDTEEWLNEIK